MEEHSANIDRLVRWLTPPPCARSECSSPPPAIAPEDYAEFLRLSNGGYSPNKFFHFFGSGGPREHNAFLWNDTALWKADFAMTDDFFAFAEDIFGYQYGFIRSKRGTLVRVLSPFTGKLTPAPQRFSEFVRAIFDFPQSYEALLHLSSRFFDHKAIVWRPYHHIAPVVHPCFGGSIEDIDNLELVGSVANLKICGQLVTQVACLPLGTRVIDVEIDPTTLKVTLVTELS
jgi:hypothetical protein